MMDDEKRLQEIKARYEATTPGEWRGDRYDGTVKYNILGGPDGKDIVLEVNHKNATSGFLGDRGDQDEEFVLHAHQDIPWLLEKIERLRAALEEIRMGAGFDLDYEHIIRLAKKALTE